MSKTYTLELTADELADMDYGFAGPKAICDKVEALAAKARLDREQSDLRLPWRAHQRHICHDRAWSVLDSEYGNPATEAAVKLQSAAPELLEAVKAMQRCWANDDGSNEYVEVVVPLIKRALRKVETGVPE